MPESTDSLKMRETQRAATTSLTLLGWLTSPPAPACHPEERWQLNCNAVIRQEKYKWMSMSQNVTQKIVAYKNKDHTYGLSMVE